MNKFEQLIEYVINDDDAKAKELFHNIVVEKSRAIYEQMMEEESIEEDAVEEEESIEEAAEDDLEEGMELGGDQADDYIEDVEMEEQGMSEDEESDDEFGDGAEEAGDDMDGMDDMGGDESGAEPASKDDILNLEDKLDQLMAEFESMMDGGADEETDDMTGIEVADDELETEGMFENVTLKAVPKPTHGDNGANNKSVVAANSGARGALAKPVHAGANEGGHHDSSAYKNNVKDMIGKVGNTPAQSTQKPTPATKAHLAQASGVNNKSVIQ